ncbi:hypothetical protein [Rhodococcus sp. PD04]|uniref:hypothetical protein n=1 Tax=Rhodococcus sp. PD04 TaxID=3109594 RepID=UPI002DD7B0F7|nr:hypothetical protein [Rhodococcus sp. PD04]WSE22313.1 hypothetical protein U9J23_22105 [Rhodococcus sp. PD04]
MAGVSIGGTDLSKVAIGETEIEKISIGDELVWTAIPPFSFVDEFATAVATGWGSQWTKIGAMSATDGRVASGIAIAVDQGFNTTKRAAWYRATDVAAPVDDVVARFRMSQPGAYTYDAAHEAVLVSRASENTSDANGVWVVLHNNQARIYTVIGGTQTARGTAGSYPMGVDLEFRAIGQTYSVVRMDTEATITSWTDSTNVVPTGAGYRGLKAAVTATGSFGAGTKGSAGFDRIEYGLA